jgi:hypothetical protein
MLALLLLFSWYTFITAGLVSWDVFLTTYADVDPCGGRLDYLHCSPASWRRQQKGEPSAWGHNWVTLSLGDINTET